MQPTVDLQFETADALAAVGLNRTAWNNVMQRSIYEAAPPVKAGRPRMFTVDDMIALYILSHYSTAVGAAMAAQIATLVKRHLDFAARAGTKCLELWVVLPSGGKPPAVFTQQPSGVFTNCIDVAKARAVIEQFAVDRLGWKRPA